MRAQTHRIAHGDSSNRAGSSLEPPRRPRLLLLATLAEVGGVVTYLDSLLPALADRFEVTVAAHGDGPLVGAAAESGARYHALKHVRRSIHPLRELLGLLELYRLCRSVRPDVLHVNSSKAGILGRLAAVPARVPVRVFSVHGWGFRTNRPAWLFLFLERLVERLTTMTICVAEAEQALGISKRTCRPGRTVVIPNGVAVAVEASSDRPPGVSTIVSVGRLKAPKDFGTLVDALSRVTQDYRAVIVGDGPDRQSVESAVEAAGLRDRVELVGERSDVREVLSHADLFVLSSRSEAMPMSVLEAMAEGLPVVAADVGGVAEVVIDEETGLLVPPEDAAALAAAIERLLADRELRVALGARGLERARTTFSLERFRADHLRAYRALLDARQLPAWSS
jgi:glycosyltransferase involved in cell wall biosynthesis